MKNFLLIPDSFKGTMSSAEVCQIMSAQIKSAFPSANVCSVPVADGGEGSVDCFLTALGGQKITLDVNGPFWETVKGFYGILDGGKIAVIEMAAAAGLPLAEGRLNPLTVTTYGVGELILDAAKRGVEKIILGLGGSCTNDFGCGAAAACGVEFFDNKGDKFVPTGGTLKNIDKINLSNKNSLLDGIEIITMCDIDNLPYGEKGAAVVFAPQKGANESQVSFLDDGVKHLCNLVESEFGLSLKELKGGGAAGAMGAGVVVFFGSKLKMGIETVLDTVGFDQKIKGVDFIFTGEGKIDGQSLGGKVVIGVCRRAKKQNVPVIAVVGGAEGDMQKAYEQGLTAVVSINRLPQDFAVSRHNSKENLAFTMQNILRLLKI